MTTSTASLRLEAARLERAGDGTPFSSVYGDVYHAAAGALAQAQHVFLTGNHLPERWAHQRRFVILETGFGLGHNFLATWMAWKSDPRACEALHFISVEKHPFDANDLRAAHAAAGIPGEMSEAVLAQWPLLVPGFHRLVFEAGRVVLTLLLGDARALLPECQAQADAIYLDGFSPARNPEMWTAPVFDALAQLAAPGCTLATWCVAGGVRHGLQSAGFQVEKAPGFTGKRAMLKGVFPGEAIPRPAAERAIIIGAGLAGTAIAAALAGRGWSGLVLESGSAPAQGASGNIAGAFRPLPSIDDNPLARLTRAGFLHGLRHLGRLAEAGFGVQWSPCGVVHVARDLRQEARMRQTLLSLQAPAELVQFVEQSDASRLAGAQTAFGGWWFPQGGWIAPPALCAANLALASPRFEAKYGVTVLGIEHDGANWRALGAAGELLAEAPALVLANGHAARQLYGVASLPLRPARGQVSHLTTAASPALKAVVCGSGYATPPVQGLMAAGATFDVDDTGLDLRARDHADNVEKLRRMLPEYPVDEAAMTGRVGLRPVSPDRLPLVGPLGAVQGLWLLSGFGARGLVWGQLCAEVLASQMAADPAPLERELVACLSPARYTST